MAITKKDFLEALEHNKSYQQALSSVDEKQQTKIKAILSAFLGHAVTNMAPVLKQLNDDPKLAEKVRKRMQRGSNSDDDVIINEELNSSGSKVD